MQFNSSIRLRLLHQHPILRLEVFSGITDELRIAWMIDRFYSDDNVHQLGMVVVNVFEQFSLCICGPGNKNRTGVCDGFSDCVKIGFVLGGVPAPD